MSDYRFTGTERVTLEIDGTFDASKVALPAGLAHDGGRISLFAFHVDKLKISGVPLLSWTYPELLWRIMHRPLDRALDTRVLHTGRDAGWVVPWGDEVGYPFAHRIAVERDSLSTASVGTPVEWADRAVVRRGRAHRCGVAHR